jgi:hypothetical protein
MCRPTSVSKEDDALTIEDMATWSPPGFITKTLGGAPAAITAATGMPYYVPIAAIVVVLIVITILIMYIVQSAHSMSFSTNLPHAHKYM